MAENTPWDIEPHGDDWFNVTDRFGCSIAEAIPTASAARMIVAAPDLRESCAELIKMVEAAHRQLGMWTDKNPRILKARAAMAKADAAQWGLLAQRIARAL